ncbi:MAG: HlyC/CorC family transporter [Rhodospirillales bacterium]|nr:HlyC/CorC family transporter [Rhodospirillales bacterium]
MPDDYLTLTGVAVVILLVISAFFSASETALTAASRPLMHQLEQNGNARAGLVNRLHARTDRLLSTILLGNNLVNILASALATSVLIPMFGDAGIVYATLAMTLLVLVFGEIVPKTFAFRRSNDVALSIAPIVRTLVVVLSPITRTLELVMRTMLWAIGAGREQASLGPSPEELRGAIELHAGEGNVVRDERAMLHSILDLGEVTIDEVMTHRRNVTMLDADEAPAEIVGQALVSPFTRIPLWRGEPDNVVGVIHAKALFRAVQSRGGNLDGLDIVELAAKPWFVPDSRTLMDQLQAFRRRREHFAIVVDEYGSMMGIVTLEDILEEIVGEISDEHDIAVPGVIRQSDGSFVVQGSVTIRDLNRELDWRLPDEEAVTLAGLVLHEAKRIPDVGQTFRFHGFRFEILRRHRHQITAIRITPPAEQERRG